MKKKNPRHGRHLPTAIGSLLVGSLVLGFFLLRYSVYATATVAPATGGSAISADTTGGSYTSLTGPVISEGATADIGVGTIILNVPSGFVFDTGGTAPTVLVTRTGGSGSNNRNINDVASGTSVAVTNRTTTQITFTVTAASSNGVTNSLTWQNVRVRPTAGTPLASGNILKTGTSSIVGVTGSTNFGTLTEVAGAKTQLAITTQPSSSATVGADFATKPVVAVRDQFGNTVTPDSSTTISRSAVLSTQSCGGTAGSGILSSTPASGAAVSSGVLTYTVMQYSAAESIKICFTSTGLTSALSDTVTVSAASDSTAPAAVADLALSNSTQSSITLTWTAPGDDGSSGTATSYDIRYSTSAITEGNFSSATQVSGEPTPLVAGTSQSMTVSGLSAGTTYYFAMKTSDEVPNTSGISNVPNLATLPGGGGDATAPAAVSDLASTGASESSITLTWTAPGDDGVSGTASSYDIRYSTSNITEGNWASATEASGEPVPSAAGATETMTVSGLTSDTTYYFALKTSDEVPNVSGLSNVVSRATLEAGAPPEEDEGEGLRQKDLIPSDIEVFILPERCTTDPKVQLLMHAHDTAEIKIGNLPDLSDGEWRPFEPGTDQTRVFEWTLSDGDGDKTVYVVLKGPFFDLVSPIQAVTIELDRTNLCQTPQEHAHILDLEGRLHAVETNPACLADFAHATVEPYLVLPDGTTRGWRDLYVKTSSTDLGVAVFSFEDGDDFAYDDAVVRMERVGHVVIAHVESVDGSNVAEIRMRVDAADRGSIDERRLWSAETDSEERPEQRIELEKYRELCASDLVPHPHPGDLFKTPDSVVYYRGFDRKRHAFPNEDVFRSWFPEETTVMVVPTYLLKSIPLGDNVTLRSGSLVRVISGAAVFLVDIGRLLREVLAEPLLAVLRTAPLSELVRLLPPALVANYSYGQPFTSLEGAIAVIPDGTPPDLNDFWPVLEGEEDAVAYPYPASILDGRVEFEGRPYSSGDVRLGFRIFDRTGRALRSSDLRLLEGGEIHLILVHDHLTDLIHVHPTEEDGFWSTDVTFFEGGIYNAYIDIDPIEGVPTVLRAAIPVGEDPKPEKAFPEPDPHQAYFDNPYRLELLTKDFVAGKELLLEFDVTKDGRPYSDLGLTFGSYGHLVVFEHGNANVYLHAHLAAVPENGSVSFYVRFPYPGRYTLFPQINVGDAYRTFPITVDVPAP